MGFGEFWLQSNNKKYNLEDLKNFKPGDIAENTKLKKIITIFDKNNNGMIDEGAEWEAFFGGLKKTAGDDNKLSKEEFETFATENNFDDDIQQEDIETLLKSAECNEDNVTVEKKDNREIIRVNGQIAQVKIKNNKDNESEGDEIVLSADEYILYAIENGFLDDIAQEDSVNIYDDDENQLIKVNNKIIQAKIIDKNGIERTYKYKYNENSVEITVGNIVTEVSKVDENGNFEDEDFVRMTYKDDEGHDVVVDFSTDDDGNVFITETTTLSENETLARIFDTDSYHTYNKLKKVSKHPEAMQVYTKGNDVYYAQYDGKGNTYIAIKSGEGGYKFLERINKDLQAMGKKNITWEELKKLNPDVADWGNLHVYSEKKGYSGTLLIPGLYNANDLVVTNSGTLEKNRQRAIDVENSRTTERLATRQLEYYTLDRNFSSLWAVAKFLKVDPQELTRLNDNSSIKKGDVVCVPREASAPKAPQTIQAKIPADKNQNFYIKYNALSETQKQQVLQIIQKTKQTDANKIKGEIYKATGINLFESDMYVKNNTPVLSSVRDYIPLEIYLMEKLNLDISKEEGLETYMDMSFLMNSSVVKSKSTGEYISVIDNVSTDIDLATLKTKIGKRYQYFDDTRTPEGRAKLLKQQEKKEIKAVALNSLKTVYLNQKMEAQNHLASVGFLDAGFWVEQVGKAYSKGANYAAYLLEAAGIKNVNQIMDKIPFYLSCANIIKEIDGQLAEIDAVLNNSEIMEDEEAFAKNFKRLTGGAIYNEAKVRNYMKTLADYNLFKENPQAYMQETIRRGTLGTGLDPYDEKSFNERINMTYWAMFGSVTKTQVRNGNDYVTQYKIQALDRLPHRKNMSETLAVFQGLNAGGNIVLMLYGTGIISSITSSAIKICGKGLGKFFGKTLLRRYTAKLLTQSPKLNSVVQGTGQALKNGVDFMIWNDAYYIGQYLAHKDEREFSFAEDLWATSKEGFAFGTYSGLFGRFVTTPLVNKVLGNPITGKTTKAAMDTVSKKMKPGKAVTGSQLLETYQLELTKISNTAEREIMSFGMEVLGFSAYEIGGALISESGGDISIKEVMEQQLKTLSSFKAVGKLLYMRKGRGMAAGGNTGLPKEQELQIKPIKENGREVYEITGPNGEKYTAANMNEAMRIVNEYNENILVYNPIEEELEKSGVIDLKNGTKLFKRNGHYEFEMEDGTIIQDNDLRSLAVRAQTETTFRGYEKTLVKKGTLKLPDGQVITYDSENKVYKTTVEGIGEVEAASVQELFTKSNNKKMFANIESRLQGDQDSVVLDNRTIITKDKNGTYTLIAVGSKGETKIYTGKSVEEVFTKLTEGVKEEINEVVYESVNDGVNDKVSTSNPDETANKRTASEADTAKRSISFDNNGIIIKDGTETSTISRDKLAFSPENTPDVGEMDLLAMLGEVNGESKILNKEFREARNIELLESIDQDGLQLSVYKKGNEIVLAVNGYHGSWGGKRYGASNKVENFAERIGLNNKSTTASRLVTGGFASIKQAFTLNKIYQKYKNMCDTNGQDLILAGYSMGGDQVRIVADMNPGDNTTKFYTFNELARRKTSKKNDPRVTSFRIADDPNNRKVAVPDNCTVFKSNLIDKDAHSLDAYFYIIDGTKIEAKDLKDVMGRAQTEYSCMTIENDAVKKGEVKLNDNTVITYDQNSKMFKTTLSDGTVIEGETVNKVLTTAQAKQTYATIEQQLKENGDALLLDNSTMITKDAEGNYLLISVSEKGEKSEISGKSVEEVFTKLTEGVNEEINEVVYESVNDGVNDKVSTSNPAETAAEVSETTPTASENRILGITPEQTGNAHDITVEIASDADLREIQQIDLEAFEGRYDIASDFDTYKADLEDQEITTYAIKGNDGKVIGYYQLEPVENGELYIHSIGVRADLRNTMSSYRAIKQMQENIAQFAKENNVKKVTLDVDADKPELLRLYKKFGFEVTSENRGYESGREYHDYHMEADVDKILNKKAESVDERPSESEVSQPKEISPFIKEDLTDAEFEEMKARVREKFPYFKFDKYNVQIADRILSTPELYNNPDFMHFADNIVCDVKTQEEAAGKIELMDKIAKTKGLYDNPNFMECAGLIVYNVTTKEETAIRIDLLDKIVKIPELNNNLNSDYMIYVSKVINAAKTPEQKTLAEKILETPKLYNNPDFMHFADNIVCDVKTQEEAAGKIELMDKIAKTKGLYDNPNFMECAGLIVYNVTTKEETAIRIDLLDKIVKIPELNNNLNSDYMIYVSKVINAAKTPEQKTLAEKILETPKLYNNPDFMLFAGNLVYLAPNPKQATIAEKILETPELYNNPDFMKSAGIIAYNAKTPELSTLINNIFKNPELYNNTDFMISVGNILDKANTPEQRTVANKILETPELYRNADFMKYADLIVNNINTLGHAALKVELMDKIAKTEGLYNNPDVMKNAGSIVLNANTSEQKTIADKILSTPELYKNSGFMKNAGSIVLNAKTPELAEIKAALLDKIAKNPEFCDNPNSNFMKYAGDVVKVTKTPENATVANKILETPELYNNPDFMKHAGDIISKANTPERASVKIEIIDKVISNEKLLNDDLLMKNLGRLLNIADENTTLQDITNYVRVLKDAFSKKDQLRSADNDITDTMIDNQFIWKKREIITAVSLIGVSNFEATYTTKLDGVLEFAEKVNGLSQYLSPEQVEKIKQKINPENTAEYIKLDNEVKELKKSYPEVAATGDKAALKELQNQIATKTKQMQEIRNNSLKLSPQSVIDKVKVLSAVAEHDKAKLDKFIDLIQKSTPENEKIWRDEVNKYVFDVMGFAFDQRISDRLNLADSKYIGEILSGNYAFKGGFKEILQLIKNNPDKSNKEIFDMLPQNIKTKEMFEKLGIDYEKYCAVDESLNVTIEVQTSMEKARKSALESLENDFNDAAFMALPSEERAKIYDALKNTEFDNKKFNVELVEKEETVYDANGFTIGTKKVQRLYKDGKPITLKDAKKVAQIVRDIMNNNDFWTTKSEDETLNGYKETMYTHFTKDRTGQIDRALDIKEDKVVNLTIRKTDMNDIVHSLFLGNHGACCTAVGTGCNQFSAPTYVMNKMISAIEVVDGDNFVGNTMCYIAEVDGKPALILDNIELKAEYHNNDAIRDAIFEYAARICEEIGQPDMSIYAGPFRHKLDMSICPIKEHEMKIVGTTGEDRIYLDFITSGRQVTGKEVDNVKLYKITRP